MQSIMNFVIKYLGWPTAIVFAVLYFQTCGHKCPKCPEIKTLTGDTSYVPKQEPVKPDTASYVPVQKPVKQTVKKSKKAEPDLYFIDEYQKKSELPYYEPMEIVGRNSLPEIPTPDIIPCPLQTSTDTQRLADRGYVVIKDLIRGSILKRDFSYNLNAYEPATPEPPLQKARWYGGIEAIGTREDWVQYAGVSFGYQPRNARALITIGGGYNMGQPSIKIGIFTQLNKLR